MKRKSLFVLAVTLGIAGFVQISVRANVRERASHSARATDAAFRDGLFLAKLDAQNGRQPHIATGRWSTTADRASFTAGYQQGYREFSEAHGGQSRKPTESKLTGQ